MKKLNMMKPTLQELNGLIARTKKEPSPENQEKLDACLRKLSDQLDEVLS